MKVIGLTGGVACGKSTVAKSLAAKGFPVVDTDEIAHELLEKNQDIRAKVKAIFGTLDRTEIRKAIFKSEKQRNELENILHPQIGNIVETRIESLRSTKKHNAAIVVVPLLFESGWDKKVEETIAVVSSETHQRERLMKRDGISADLANRMISSQLSNSEKERRATHVVRNDGTLTELETATQRLAHAYKSH